MDIVKVLETYRGRDKIIRTCAYLALWAAGDSTSNAAVKLRTIFTEFGACRSTLRLFDDLPMLAHNLYYGLGSKESNSLLRILDLATNLCNQLFYPVEHVAWLANKKIISAEELKWIFGSLVIWAVSLAFEILKNIVRIFQIKRKLHTLYKQKRLETEEGRNEITEQSELIKTQMYQQKAEMRTSYLTLIQSLSDFMNAINWMPPGFLWAGKLSKARSGMFGTISSLIMLYKVWPAKSMKEKVKGQ
ncbi:hypothetical protein KUTeg_011126 [Tegillarca granosa]|uniref:Peroxisomal membrane protein 11C n=1 Tax=Tegillarca granosa TaxID=220873 RepID=A0ABQ9F6E0_TEGGR|nr:hypothetical protein KUTeg_011126 [Tegillarca granosa]